MCHFLKLGLKAVPPIQSKTSLPQTWHIPQRTEGLAPKQVDNLKIHKVKPVRKPTKRKRVSEGISSNVYCPVSQPIPSTVFSSQLVKQLRSIQSDAQILNVLPAIPCPPSCTSKFGPVPPGSVLSYQQKVIEDTGDIINHSLHPTFLDFPFPQQPATYHVVLSNAEQDMFSGLHVTHDISKELETETRQQSMNKTWHDVRRYRLTSSVFKQICSRKADFESLATRMLKKCNIQTAAMKYGIEHEPEVAKLYSDITGNNVYLCGFVVNPSAPHLGASPDRKVFDPNATPPFGLLEIKCPAKDNFSECKYLRKAGDGTYRLKTSHQYYFQVMGQMALTGMNWCDLLVKCRDDYHLERVSFDRSQWIVMKTALDSFFFTYFLPQVCSQH